MAQYQISGRTAAGIAASIEAGIASGAIAPAELLPPVRALAVELEVSPGTVASAYRLARQRGLTVSDRRRGTRARPWVGPQLREGGRRPADEPGGDALDLASGAPDPALLPDVSARLGDLRYEPGSYGSNPISPRLESVAAALLRADGVVADGITCTSGTLDAINRLLAHSLRAGDRVALEDPGWAALIASVRSLGLSPVPLELDSEGVLPNALWDRLAGGARAVVITNRAQNPTGAALSRRRRDELSAVLARYPGVTVIEDDHGDGITTVELNTLAGARGTAGRPGPFVFIRSVGKSLGPDLRLAVVAGDRASIARLSASLAAGPGWVSYLLQTVVAELWSNGRPQQVAALYDERREALRRALAAVGVEVAARSGLNVWLPVEDETAAVSRLASLGYRVAAGAPFRLASPAAIRITTASLLPDRAGPLARAIAEARHPARTGY